MSPSSNSPQSATSSTDSSQSPGATPTESASPEPTVTSDDEAVAATASAQEDTPVLRKPPMRPVRPQPPAQPAAAKTVTASQPTAKPEVRKPEVTTKPEIISVSISSAVKPEPTSEVDQVAQAALRQQPIPPPSEPKQYRAIGLVRGSYTPSEEEFTRGDFQAADGTSLKAVLLGRVMSLVKNHIDLQKEHLWVVYPRTREEEKELHLQIVGVWEPETLKKPEDGEDVAEVTENGADVGFADPRLGDGYFSVRGEVVFIAPEEQFLVVKIQQTPRKNSQKAKAFKLAVKGELEGDKAVGYFWDLHVARDDNTLIVTEATCIGLAPPKRRSKDMVGQGRPRRPSFGRGKEMGGRPSRPTGSRPPRDPASKPIKRVDRAPASED